MHQITTRILSIGVSAALLFASSCKSDDNNGPEISPKGPPPTWGPSMHKEMLTVIEQLDSFNVPPLPSLTPQQARAQQTIFDAEKVVARQYNLSGIIPTADTFGRDIPVAGGSIHARIYKPNNGQAVHSAIVYYHGGGWVIATVGTYDASARALAEQTGAVVVSVEYRKGPEAKFPTAHDDAFAAYQWVLSNATSLNINASKIAVAGESAGGNLACNVSIAARKAGIKIPNYQLLVYPVAQNDLTTASYVQYADAQPLNVPLINWFLMHYLNSPSESADPRINLVAADLTGLPPTTIINAEIDPLRDDGLRLETALKAVGVSVNRRVYDGVTHEFFGLSIVLPEAREAQAVAVDALRTALQ